MDGRPVGMTVVFNVEILKFFRNKAFDSIADSPVTDLFTISLFN